MICVFPQSIRLGETTNKNLAGIPDINNVERCQCIPQQYFEEICTDTELKRFSDEINNVIFSGLSEMDKENCRGFDELIDKYTKSADTNIGYLINDLTNVNREIIDKESKILSSYKTKQEGLLKDANTQLAAHMSIKPKQIENVKSSIASAHPCNSPSRASEHNLTQTLYFWAL